MMYTGYENVPDSEIAKLYEGLPTEKLYHPNQYLINNETVVRHDSDGICNLRYETAKKDTFKPKNIEQRMAFDLMCNEKIPIKFLTGIAGSGKTKIALQFGIKALQEGLVEKLFIVRQPSPVGEDIGFLKGTKEDKLAAWFKPIIDNLDGGLQDLERMIQDQRIEMEAPAFMQGRDLPNCWIIVDEAQLLLKDTVKMLGSRVGEGSFITFCGDTEQIFNKKYGGNNNGLVYANEKLAGHPLFGCVHLTESVRGPVAELFATQL